MAAEAAARAQQQARLAAAEEVRLRNLVDTVTRLTGLNSPRSGKC